MLFQFIIFSSIIVANLSFSPNSLKLPISRPFSSLSKSTVTNSGINKGSSTCLHGSTFKVQESLDSQLKYEQVHFFGKGQKNKNNKNMKFLLGGKGANLADMSAIGLSVPPGFTITTEVCDSFCSQGNKLPLGTWEKVLNSMTLIEKEMKRGFGDPIKPLLVSVRSGAAISMPGMMDTVLNLGLNDETVKD